MEMIVKKWGNSLAARIPKAIAETVDLHLNQKVKLEAQNGKIIITPVAEKKEYKIDELLSQCSVDSLDLDSEDKTWLIDEPVGREW